MALHGDNTDAAVADAVRVLTAEELDALVEAFDAIPARTPRSWGGDALRLALNAEEGRRALAGEHVIYSGRNAR